MVKYNERQLDRAFKALADPTRRAMIARLAGGKCLVSDLAQPFAMSLPAISKHLNVLETAGLVSREKVGRERHCRLNPAAMQPASAWIEAYRHFWQARLDSLAQVLKSEN